MNLSSYERNYSQIREIVKVSGLVEKGLPVYYPGCGNNIGRPFDLADAKLAIYNDFGFVRGRGRSRKIDEQLIPVDRITQDLGGQVTDIGTEGILGSGGKRVIDFILGGNPRRAIFYAEDATTFIPYEIEQNGMAFLIIYAPTAGPRFKGGRNPGDLLGDAAKARLLSYLVPQGFTQIALTSRYLPIELTGFTQVVQPEIDNEGRKLGFSLLQKQSQVPELETILNLDAALAQAIQSRDGRTLYSIDKNTLRYYASDLRKLRKIYDLLSLEQQEQVLMALKSYLTPYTVSISYLNRIQALGQGSGINTQEKAINYFIGSKQLVFKLFPELKR